VAELLLICMHQLPPQYTLALVSTFSALLYQLSPLERQP
jgi:hypothetical protein